MGQKNGKPFTDPYNQKDPQTLDFTGVWGPLGIPADIKIMQEMDIERNPRNACKIRPCGASD